MSAKPTRGRPRVSSPRKVMIRCDLTESEAAEIESYRAALELRNDTPVSMAAAVRSLIRRGLGVKVS